MNDVSWIKIPLPDDVLRQKMAGHMEEAIRTIDHMLSGFLPECMRKRLEMEKQIIGILNIEEYPYDYEAALALLKESFVDFKDEELDQLIAASAADWIYIEGKIHFHKKFFDNIVKTRPDYSDRLKTTENDEFNTKRQKMLNDNVAYMKINGGRTIKTTIRASVRINKDAERVGEKVRVYLPIPQICRQNSDIQILEASPEITYIADENAPQRTVCFETVLKPDQEFFVRYSFINHVKYVDPKPEAVTAIKDKSSRRTDTAQASTCPKTPVLQSEPVCFKTLDLQSESAYTEIPVSQSESDSPTTSASHQNYNNYLDEQAPHIIFTPFMKELLDEIRQDETNPLVIARRIYDFITTKVKYSFVREYAALDNISEYAAKNLKGDCGVQAILFITLCRLAGIPARWQSGLYATDMYTGCHDWAEFYVEPYGWMYADPSFGGSAYRTGQTERWNYYFGNLDIYRMVANSAMQSEFNPPKRYFRADPVDNQRGEVEYENRGLDFTEFTAEQVTESMEDIELK